MKERVVNLRLGEEPYHDPCDVYIGRACRGWKASKWANPFKLRRGADMGERAACIGKYAKWIVQQPELMAALPELRGKRLGCWCAPLLCHGNVLIDLLEHRGGQRGK